MVINEKNLDEICDLSGIIMASDTNSSNTGGCVKSLAKSLVINLPLKVEEISKNGDIIFLEKLPLRTSIHQIVANKTPTNFMIKGAQSI